MRQTECSAVWPHVMSLSKKHNGVGFTPKLCAARSTSNEASFCRPGVFLSIISDAKGLIYTYNGHAFHQGPK